MVKFRLYVICLGIAIAMTGCWPKVFNKKDFTLYEAKGHNDMFKNGYYHSAPMDNGVIRVKILLNNGFIKNESGSYGSDCGESPSLRQCLLKNVERHIDQIQDTVHVWKNKSYTAPQWVWGKSPISLWDWGKYEIKEGKIFIQYFYNRFGDYYLIEERGEILNDSSFVIKEQKDYRTKITLTLNEQYTFKEFNVEKLNSKAPLRLNYPKLKIVP